MTFDEFYNNADQIARQYLFNLNIDQIEDLFNDEDCLIYSGASSGPMYIFPNGNVYSVNDMHVYALDDIIQKYLLRIYSDQVTGKKDINAQIDDIKTDSYNIADNMLNEFTNHFGIIRVNGGKEWDRRFYSVFPNKIPTNIAFYSFEDVINRITADTHQVFILSDNSRTYSTHSFFMDVMEGKDIVRTIRRYYSTGEFYESMSNIALNGLIEEYMNNFFTKD